MKKAEDGKTVIYAEIPVEIYQQLERIKAREEEENGFVSISSLIRRALIKMLKEAK